MEIHKGFIDLLGYGVVFGELTIIPIRIDVFDDDKCQIEFKTVNKQAFERKIIRKGTHKNFIFTTSINKVPFSINLQTGVIKKIRIRDKTE